jgi:cell division protein FtsA
MSGQSVVALDIGSTKVACMMAELSEDRPGYQLLGTSLLAYAAPSSTGAASEETGGGWPFDVLLIGRTIEQAIEAAGVTGELFHANVAVSHPGLRSEIVSSSVTLADEPITVRTTHLERLARAALTQALGVDRQALLIERLSCVGNGFEGVRDPRGLSATRLLGTFHIVSIPTAVQRALTQAVESAGLEVADITYSLMADAAVVCAVHAPTRFLLIDIGGLQTDVGLVVGGQLVASATVPWGGLTLALAVARAAHVTVEQATTFSLKGFASSRPEVRQCLGQPLQDIRRVIRTLLQDEPKPDQVFLTGRGALIDGIAEWVEQATDIKASLSRSTRLQESAELSRQVGLSTAMGLIELATQTATPMVSHSSRLFDRLITQTKTLLTEYF